jgi:predicted patatin/cPLA2 family phospholipase
MNLDNEELLVTKHKRKLISYTKQVASGKLDKNFYNAYCELYDLLCEYMNAYNKVEERIKELEKELEYMKIKEGARQMNKELANKMEQDKLHRQELKDMIIGMLE